MSKQDSQQSTGSKAIDCHNGRKYLLGLIVNVCANPVLNAGVPAQQTPIRLRRGKQLQSHLSELGQPCVRGLHATGSPGARALKCPPSLLTSHGLLSLGSSDSSVKWVDGVHLRAQGTQALPVQCPGLVGGGVWLLISASPVGLGSQWSGGGGLYGMLRAPALDACLVKIQDQLKSQKWDARHRSPINVRWGCCGAALPP